MWKWGIGFVSLLVISFLFLPPYRTDLPSWKEGATKSNLKALRAAISIYVEDKKKCPTKLEALLGPYIAEIPLEKIQGSNRIVPTLDGTGGWYFNSKDCTVVPNILGSDSKGLPYMNY